MAPAVPMGSGGPTSEAEASTGCIPSMRPEIVEPPGLGQVGTGVEPKFVQDARFPEEVDNVVLARAEPATRAEPKFVKDARVPEGVDNELPAEAEPTARTRENQGRAGVSRG